MSQEEYEQAKGKVPPYDPDPTLIVGLEERQREHDDEEPPDTGEYEGFSLQGGFSLPEKALVTLVTICAAFVLLALTYAIVIRLVVWAHTGDWSASE